MDDNFVELIKSQQDNGLRLLKKEYAGLLHYIVGGILTNNEDIEECISDIYIKVWHSVESYSSEKGKFPTWLTAIARNTALNYQKRRKIDSVELKEQTADSYSLESHVLRQEQAEELKLAIHNILSSEEQRIFYRKYYYLQKTAQIAKELGTTERSIEGKLYRLKKKLQTKLGGDFR